MAAREMCFSDDFRMRSTVVWLCFGIIVLCAIAGDCDAKRRYSDVHYRQAGPVLRSVLPMFRYRNLDGQVVAHPVKELREEDDEEEPEGDDAEPGDEDDGADPGEEFEAGEAGDEDFGENIEGEPFEDEEEHGEDDEEEEDEEQDEDQEEEEDEEVEEDPELRQAFINNQYVPRPSTVLRQGQRPLNNINNNNRVPLNNNNNKNNNNKPLVQREPNNNVNNFRPNQQLNAPNRRNPNPGQNVLSGQQNLGPNQNRLPQGVAPNNGNNMKGNNKQRLQLRPVAQSTQFIATPVADLILRLSISIAKPNNARGAANVNVPIRIGPGNTFYHDDITGLKTNKTETIAPKSNIVLSAPLALEMPSELAAENIKDNGNESSTAVPVTELP